MTIHPHPGDWPISSDTEALSWRAASAEGSLRHGQPEVGCCPRDRGWVKALLLRLLQPQLRPPDGCREQRKGEKAGVTQDSQRPHAADHLAERRSSCTPGSAGTS